jgi:hypothetical protein
MLVEIHDAKYGEDPDMKVESGEEFADNPTIVIHPQCRVGDE